jgi:hypothetical protein
VRPLILHYDYIYSHAAHIAPLAGSRSP